MSPAPSFLKPLSAAFAALAVLVLAAPGEVRPLDAGWRFSRGDFAGAERPVFDDGSWRTVNLPHDWGIEGPFDPANPAGGAGAFLPTGVGWYRKTFDLPARARDLRVYAAFDGVMMNSDVWINGTHLGRRPNGYVSFRYLLPAKALKFGPGARNVLAVRVNDADQPASRWYAGAGIYRHVRLELLDPVHLEPDGIFVTTPVATPGRAVVRVEATVDNDSADDRDVTVGFDLERPGETAIAPATAGISRRIAAHGSATVTEEIALDHPQLWDLGAPRLYSARVEVRAGAAASPLDSRSVDFGIRDAHFEAATGFWLNGKNLKVKGVCIHADGSAFGAAVPLDVWERRLTILKGLGVNAIRCAHNPPAPEFLDLCDRMGFLVMDEMFDCWTVAKNIADYHLYFEDWSKRDVRDTVRRDRNHPSIILYSAGNEIHDTPDAELSKRILSGLVAVFHENDPTRPVTQALLRPNATHDYDDGLADLLDVIGTNYRDEELLAAHDAKPDRKIIGTENHHDRQAWLAVRDHPPYAGQFLWAGIDYLGESPLWPLVSSRAGLIDRVGTPHPLAYERESWWSDRPVVRMVRRIAQSAPRVTDPGYTPVTNYRLRPEVLFRDWTPADLGPHDETVEVYSNAPEVELFLNDRSLGTQPLHADASPRQWKVPFEPGRLRAVATDGGRIVATDELRTAGAPARIAVSCDKAELQSGWDHVATVTAEVVDADGVPVPDASNPIHFRLSGAGAMRLDSGDNASHESFFADERRAYRGICVAYVQTDGGPLEVTVESPGLTGGSVRIAAPAGTQAADPPPKTWIDPDTGHRVWRVTDEPDTASLYFNDNPFTPDGKEMIFTSPEGVSVLDLGTMKSRRVVDGPVRVIEVGRKTPTVFYTRTDGVLYGTNIDTGQTRKLAVLPPRGGVDTINADETLAAGVRILGDGRDYGSRAPGQNHGLLQPEDKTKRMDARLAARLPMEMYTIDLRTGERKVILHSTDWLNHLQFSPTDPTRLMYCHEGQWWKVDRIWLIRADGTGNTLVQPRIMGNEADGHEFWSHDGSRIYYDLHLPYGTAFYVASYDVATQERVWYSLPATEWSIHYNASEDETLLCGDGSSNAPDWCYWATRANQWIFLFRPERIDDRETPEQGLIHPGRLRAERLVNMARHGYLLEPNVFFSPDKRLVFFRSNLFGPTYVFAVETAGSAPIVPASRSM